METGVTVMRHPPLSVSSPTGSARTLTALLLGLTASAVLAVPPAELQHRLDRGDKITVIDVRSNALYAKGHIPGAINIPASLISAKRLPALGEVVVYGEGLGRDSQDAAQSLELLNQKPGIRAVNLDGGFAAWDAAQRLSTKSRGMKREEITYITYDQLKRSQDKLVLVDLRETSTAGKTKSLAATTPLSDLRREFPGFNIIKDPFAAASKAGGDAAEPVLILIDRNDGTAEDTVRKLRAQGRKRVVVLAGGEEIIAHGGRPGLERIGPGSVVDQTRTGKAGLNN